MEIKGKGWERVLLGDWTKVTPLSFVSFCEVCIASGVVHRKSLLQDRIICRRQETYENKKMMRNRRTNADTYEDIQTKRKEDNGQIGRHIGREGRSQADR